MVTHGHKGTPIPGPQKIGGIHIENDDVRQDDVEIELLAGEREPEQAVGISECTAGTAGEPFGPCKEILENVLRSEGGDREIEAFDAGRRQPDDHADDSRDQTAERN